MTGFTAIRIILMGAAAAAVLAAGAIPVVDSTVGVVLASCESPSPTGVSCASPSPSAAPSPTATLAPSSIPTPTTSPLATIEPSPSQPPTALPSPSPHPPVPPTRPVSPRLLSPTAGSHEFTIASPSMAVTNLAYVGTQQVTSGSVTLTELQFTADQIQSTGLTLIQSCFTHSAITQSFKVTETVPATVTAVLTGPITLLATSLSYTPTGGPTVTFDATALPPVGVLVPAGTLPVVQITATDLTAASISTLLTEQVGAC